MKIASDEGKFDNLLKNIRQDLVTYDKGVFGINYEVANERRDYVKQVENYIYVNQYFIYYVPDCLIP